MNQQSRIVFAIDGLRASSLGVYGNSVIETPAFDQLATQGITYDWCHVPATSLLEVYRTLWTMENRPDLVVTDEPIVAGFAEAFGIETFLVENRSADAARNFSDTLIAELVAQTTVVLDEQNVEGSIWIHSRGFFGPWDSPHEVAQSLTEEGDPEIPWHTHAPDFSLSGDDGDPLFVETCRYHAQLIAIDAVLEGFLDWLAIHERYQHYKIILCGTRGFSLGEHGYIGGNDSRLYGEQTHVPCLVQNKEQALQRDHKLLWLGDLLRNPADPAGHPQLVWHQRQQVAVVRTHEWLGRFVDSDGHHELFVKPDDRFEANDIASLCPDELSQLAEAASKS